MQHANEAMAMIPAARPSIPSMRLTAFIAPKTAIMQNGIARMPRVNPPQTVTTPVRPRNKPGSN